MADVMYDPLAINLRRQVRRLIQKLPQNMQYAAELSNVAPTRQLLLALSRLLAHPALTGLIAKMFRPVLMDLCARWVDENENDEYIEERLVAIAFLVEVQEELFPILDKMLQNPRLKDGPLALLAGSSNIETSRLHALLVAYYRILQANRQIPEMFLWSLSPLSEIFWSENHDNASKLLAVRCYAMQTCMGEAGREELEREVLGGKPFESECPLDYGRRLDGKSWVVDGWLLPVLEVERVREWRSEVLQAVTREEYYVWEDGEKIEEISVTDLSPLVVNIYGVLLLRSKYLMPDKPGSVLIPTPSAIAALRTLATHLSLRLPTLLTSTPSSGKSLLLTHLASLLYPGTTNQIVTIHLADTSLDPRALLGSYISSPTSPGTFEWKEGVVVRAMREGRWIVFEDVDKASSEVLGTIRPLIESLRLGRWIGQRGEMDVPGQGRVVAADGFRVFATRSVKIDQHQGLKEGGDNKISPPVFLGAGKFWEVVIKSPIREELRIILDEKYRKLRGAPTKSLIDLWEKTKELGGGGRVIGVRELEKLCMRVQNLLPANFQVSALNGDEENNQVNVDEDTKENPKTGSLSLVPLSAILPSPSLREDIFGEARDVLFGGGALTASARFHADAVARTVGDWLGLDMDRQQWLLAGRVPPFDEERDVNGRLIAVYAGYTRLLAKPFRGGGREEIDELAHEDVAGGKGRPFAMHKPATVLLSRIARAIALNEPVLLTGETGTGKTSVVTHLARLLRRNLVSLNLSHQTESGDLLGGFKPVDARMPASVLMERWEELFSGTFSRRKNEKFDSEVRKAVRDGRWARLVGLWRESGRLAKDRIRARKAKVDDIRWEGFYLMTKMLSNACSREVGSEEPRKRRRVEQNQNEFKVSDDAWTNFLENVNEFEVQHIHAKGKFAFGFVEGPLVKALKSGDWCVNIYMGLMFTSDKRIRILLDEINLASSETLECITGILHTPTASITLTEQGALEPVPRHPDFRLFACMNPATDVGKKDLPPNIRARFTEIDVPPPDADKETLLSIVTKYIGSSAVGDKAAIMNVTEFYQNIKALSEQRQIADGSNRRPHYSMRTLVRALTFASEIANVYGFPLRRAIWEGCLMAFTMILDRKSAEAVRALAYQHVLAGVGNPRSLLTKEPSVPRGRPIEDFVKFGPFYLEKGPYHEDPMVEYIMTPSVESKLIDLARIVLTRRFPVLIEGPTSSGKTSAVEYLAKKTGHRFVRINNHEHTDIQEYLGSYVSDPLTGKLVFKDGLLVRALRNGDWIVLDELNLAPTDVLEALNRLLDDNRELMIPETQEVVKPHPHFMLFATQNPPGLYAGRKVLSRAFRNRFLEVHFEDVPQAELEIILCERCRIAPPYGGKIVTVFRELQKRRQTSRVFESKHGFATLRDLFRWAERDAVGYQELAENGYMLIGERVRQEDDKAVVKEVIESVMGVRIDEKAMYSFENPNVADLTAYLGCPIPRAPYAGVVWTSAMQRLFILVCRALRFKEPILLVGETGSGKTSVCQVYADAVGQKLLGLNCHQNTETADLIGGLRPLRNKSAAEADVINEATKVLSEVGVDGIEPVFDVLFVALNKAIGLRNLDDESKAKILDAQRKLLRLNSIFEWHDGPLVEAMRKGNVFLLDEISLADDSVLERLNSVLEPSRTIVLAERGGEANEQAAVKAEEQFKLVATMNPGGDYGKKELSPALRNRFTEIWVPPVEERRDLESIVGSSWKHESLNKFTKPLLDFTEWLCSKVSDRSVSNLRDILAWVMFTNSVYRHSSMLESEIFHNAAHMTFLDGLSSFPSLSSYSKEAILKLKSEAEMMLEELVPFYGAYSTGSLVALDTSGFVNIGPFSIAKGSKPIADHVFNLQAPTTRDNVMRIVRACQVNKPILLEGSPGVGKTSLVMALANVAGHHLCRINLSDQTDLADLFGSDLPVEGGGPGEFAWRDAEFLKAMQAGYWVLLDEMNLAPQAVLEGLNAVLDHRGTVYIPELDRSFSCHPSFRIFAAQNPLNQGGGRKGLPKSFVNRFTKVYVEELSSNDLLLICQQLFPELDEVVIRLMITFNMRLSAEVVMKHSFARQGSPWEFNLRDVIRWGSLLRAPGPDRHPVDHLRSVYLHRFRTVEDRVQARSLFDQTFRMNSQQLLNRPQWGISANYINFGYYTDNRKNFVSRNRAGRILKKDLAVLESIGLCISQSWLTILTGPQSGGKTEVIRLLAHFTGHILHEISVNSATDTMDILGSFEQVDHRGRAITTFREIQALLDVHLRWPKQNNFRSLHYSQETLRSGLANKSMLKIDDLLRLGLEIVDNMDDAFLPTPSRQRLCSELKKLLFEPEATVRFDWIDGPLVQAMKNGHWLLLDNANLCNPSVLDRLNSLCETNGFLTLSERGFVNDAVQIIKPHPNFRLFMTVDPQFGELSRAMRNRGIEISLIEPLAAHDWSILFDHLRLPSIGDKDWKHQSLIYDCTRRGCYDQMIERSIPSSGRIIEQDSALNYLTEQAPAIIKDSLLNEDLTSSHFLFLSRVLIPSYLLPYRRLLAALDLQNFTSPKLLEFICRFPFGAVEKVLAPLRGSYSLSRVLSSNSTFVQPMDFYLILPVSMSDSLGQREAIVHETILQVLDLAVALLLDEMEMETLHTLIDDSPQRKSNELRIIHTIDALLKNIKTAVLTYFGNLDLTNEKGQLNSIQGMIKVMRYSHHLRQALKASHLDYSTIIALSRSILDDLDNCHDMAQVMEYARQFCDTISLSSGLGLLDIWKSMYTDDSSWSLVTRLDTLAASLAGMPGFPDLRRRIFDYMSLTTMPMKYGRQNIAVKARGQELEQILHEHATINSLRKIQYPEPASLVVEFGVLSAFGSQHDLVTLSPAIEEMIELASNNANALLVRMLPYKQMIWCSEANKSNTSLASYYEYPQIVARMHLQWLRDIWSTTSGDDNANGPSKLLQPTLLYTVHKLNDWEHRPLSSLLEYEAQIENLARMTLIQCERGVSRVQQLLAFLHQSLLLVGSCFRSHFSHEMYDLLLQSPPGDMDSILHVISLLEQTTHLGLAKAVQQILLPLLNPLARNVGSPVPLLGQAWVCLSQLLLQLLVPNHPVDPAAVQNSTVDRLKQDLASLTTQISLHTKLEHVLTGNSENGVIHYLTKQGATIHAQLSDNQTYPVGRELSQLHMYWSEVAQFHDYIVNQCKVSGLVSFLSGGDQEGLLSQEIVVQQSIAGFYQRLDSAYPEFSDLNVLLGLSLLYLRFGLRLIAQSSILQRPTVDVVSLTRLSSILVSLPSLVDSTALDHTTDTAFPTTTAMEQVILQLSILSLENSSGIDIETTISRIDIAYEQALQLWLVDRVKEQEREKEANSLYRQTTTQNNELSEAEIEEQELLQLFPSFDDALSLEASRISVNKHQPNLRILPENTNQIAQLHLIIMRKSTSMVNHQILNDIRASSIGHLLQNYLTVLPATVDVDSLPFQLTTLSNRLLQLRAPVEKAGYNFYLDHNVSEAKKALNVVKILASRLEALILEWPDQMVLQHLRDKCDSFLKLSISSPVAKLLSALEQLLLQTEDWEIYANKENTLKPHQQAISSMIVEWRRLELSGWRMLLDSQLKAHASEASPWWFRLYDACVHGGLKACEEELNGRPEALSEYIANLIPLLDEYILSSPLGQFQARLQLLHSFEVYLHFFKNTRTGAQHAALDRIQRILYSTACYFHLYSLKVSTSLSDQKAPLEKQVQDFIKLASWRDINIQALKASAQRTHHQLFKTIRRFREVLKQPILDKLTPEPAGDGEMKPLDISHVQVLDGIDISGLPEGGFGGASSKKEHLFHLKRTFKRYDYLVSARIRPFIHSHSARIVDEFATEVIITTRDLSDISISNNIPIEKREKQSRALLVRKRKAWSDLLKELKRAGFSVSPKPEVLYKLSNECWLREQAILCGDGTGFTFEKIEGYFACLRGMMPRLRPMLASHHSDVSTRELQRGLLLLESVYSLAIDLRSRLAQSTQKFINFSNTVTRIKMLSACPKVISVGDNTTETIRCIKDILCRLYRALSDVRHGISVYDGFRPRIPVPEKLFNEVDSIMNQTNDMRSQMVVLLQKINMSKIPFLLAGKSFKGLRTACEHISHVNGNLETWSRDHPRLNHLFHPVIQWLKSQDTSPTLSSSSFQSGESSANRFIDTLLVNVQSLLSQIPEQPPTNEADHYIISQCQIVRTLTHLVNIDTFSSCLDSVTMYMLSHPLQLESNIKCVLPFIEVYFQLVNSQLANHCDWTKALFKLAYVLCSIMHTLARQGFCKPPDASNSGDGNGGDEAHGGVGIGEGSGTRNVSKEIEDDSQVEGLKGDKEDQESDKDKYDGDAIEMGEDIEGEMEDVPDKGSEDEGSNSDGDESEADPEERLENLDASDPSAVDEKLWGDEKGPEDSDQVDGKTGQDHAEEQNGDPEVVAKEGKEREKRDKDKKEKCGEEDEEEKGPQGDETEDDMKDGDQENQGPSISGAPLTDHIPDAETLDLPEDMNIDDRETEPDDAQVEEDYKMEIEEPGIEEIEIEDNIEDLNGGDPVEEKRGEAGEKVAEEAEGEEEKSRECDMVAQANVSAGDGGAEPNNTVRAEGEEGPSTGQETSNEANLGDQTEDMPEDGREDKYVRFLFFVGYLLIWQPISPPQGDMGDQPQTASQSAVSFPHSPTASGAQEGQTKPDLSLQTESNPIRSLGDALKEIHQRFDEILNSEPRNSLQEKVGDTSARSQLEYLRPDDVDHEMQALGPAGEEQIAKLDDLQLTDDDVAGNDVLPMNVDPELNERLEHLTPQDNSLSSLTPEAKIVKDSIEGAVSHEPWRAPDQLASQPESSMHKANVEIRDDPSHDLELEVKKWQTSGFMEEDGSRIWRLYEALTHDLAYALCEQLRLVLEPTLATRLKGDYRTGKRLNMKKIIPYIASDYSKDKIWLRRTRPSQREYQILIALDDSRSMAESHSVHLAFQTLALVSKALSRLESGDIAIAKFGETVHMVHNFDDGQFTDQAGTKVISSFRFNQKATNVLSFVETSLKYLETARERRSTSSATASDLWQLEIIISDGLCQDHDRLRTALRKAEEQRVMVVFIIVDSLHSQVGTQSAGQNSILHMDKAEYKFVDGRMELQLQKYLDTFPFEYYVVLRNVEALPGVLAGTLKQFFERISES
ncbi:hypothetical protein AMATHDRAFT_1433 [Amanita thiersii Skay4041]|uniref:Midasin n=1 Tax=Amanita thiersii Skay4041 TaxID=703135 RepID=A0A2A9NQY5_9AGAR|nr:hypothetical protein AMATHDRAFT_1433 [Amanita thiersii Skay4041]